MAVRQPPVIWAQRESFLYVTIEIDDVKIEDLTADSSKLHFKGTSHTEVFETTMEFFDEINGEGMKRTPTNTRVIELTIPKKESKWWPRLLKEKGKVHWLKVDFDKWKDEDDSGAEDGMPFGGDGGFDLNSYMNQMGGVPPSFHELVNYTSADHSCSEVVYEQ
ncbi:CS domain protein [Ancylostoma ceylanicum]|uniref:CS domain protein n=1 Tax=Ancylostoma ceylanicum TaxID=53326 RepID=A0A0D6LZR2_9BILA|nr:CS domain protein [Ancylostoma ceylanicum]